MTLTTILPIALFGLFTVGLWFVMDLLSKNKSKADERLEALRKPKTPGGVAEGEKGAVSGMLEKAAPKLSSALKPQSELEQNALKVRLANAGFNSPGASQLFLSVKMIGLITGLLLGGGVAALKFGLDRNGLVALVVGGGIGFYLPELALRVLISRRVEEIFLSLPDVLDLLVVCVEAGLGLDAGMRRVAEELGDTHKAVCEELNLCNMQLQMGRPRRDVLHDLGVRSGVDDMRALAAILIQADRFGSSIGQALRVQSDSMRVKRSQLAEERAQKTAVQMIFPLVLFIFPGIFVVLVGPAAIMLMDGLINN